MRGGDRAHDRQAKARSPALVSAAGGQPAERLEQGGHGVSRDVLAAVVHGDRGLPVIRIRSLRFCGPTRRTISTPTRPVPSHPGTVVAVEDFGHLAVLARVVPALRGGSHAGILQLILGIRFGGGCGDLRSIVLIADSGCDRSVSGALFGIGGDLCGRRGGLRLCWALLSLRVRFINLTRMAIHLARNPGKVMSQCN